VGDAADTAMDRSLGFAVMPGARAAVPVAVVLAALSLAVHRALAFDPEAWVVWGREARSLAIDTSAGPSWKPLPVLVTTLLGANPWLWLLVARAAALLAVAGVARLVWARAGPTAAAVAAALLVISPWWLLHGALGNAEPMLVALAAWAAVAHGGHRHGWAFGLGCAAALLRPEAWPFLALYGTWLVRTGRLRVTAVAIAGAAIAALWVVPDQLASGLESTRGAHTRGSAGSAGRAEVPFLAVWRDAAQQLTPPLLVTLAAGLATRRLRGSAAVWLAAGAAWVLIVAVMAQAGFAGTPRYLVPGLAALAAAAATVAARPPFAVLLVAAVLAFTAGDLRDALSDLAHRERVRVALDEAVAGAGARCRPLRTGPDERTLVARVLGQSIPGSVARPAGGDGTLRLSGERWTLRC
jgi:hypothetical protein